MPTPAAAPSKSELKRARCDYLDAMMAAGLTAWQSSMLLTRLFSGHSLPDGEWVRRSRASFVERAGRGGSGTGRKGKADREAHKQLKDLGWWERDRATHNGRQDGPKTPWRTRLLVPPPTARRRKPNTNYAYTAAKSLALHVSPVGPALELALLNAWWSADASRQLSGSSKDWARVFSCSETTAVRYLAALHEAELGLMLTVQRPERAASAPVVYAVELRLPDLSRLKVPDGALRHAADQEEYREFAAAVQREREAMEAAGSAQAQPSPQDAEAKAALHAAKPSDDNMAVVTAVAAPARTRREHTQLDVAPAIEVPDDDLPDFDDLLVSSEPVRAPDSDADTETVPSQKNEPASAETENEEEARTDDQASARHHDENEAPNGEVPADEGWSSAEVEPTEDRTPAGDGVVGVQLSLDGSRERPLLARDGRLTYGKASPVSSGVGSTLDGEHEGAAPTADPEPEDEVEAPTANAEPEDEVEAAPAAALEWDWLDDAQRAEMARLVALDEPTATLEPSAPDPLAKARAGCVTWYRIDDLVTEHEELTGRPYPSRDHIELLTSLAVAERRLEPYGAEAAALLKTWLDEAVGKGILGQPEPGRRMSAWLRTCIEREFGTEALRLPSRPVDLDAVGDAALGVPAAAASPSTQENRETKPRDDFAPAVVAATVMTRDASETAEQRTLHLARPREQSEGDFEQKRAAARELLFRQRT